MEKLPQRLVNVRVRDRSAIDDADAVWAAVEEESGKLEGIGRVLVRPSGTEPFGDHSFSTTPTRSLGM